MITYRELTDLQAVAALRDYLVLALRATGPDPTADRIFQLGMLRVEDGAVVNTNSTLIDPGRPIPPELTELTGVRDEDAARGLRYPQMASSLAALLLDAVVVADEEALGFVRPMLEAAGFSGSFAFVDVRTLAFVIDPALGALSIEELAEALGAHCEDAPGILREAALRCAILQGCIARIPEPAGEEAPAEPEVEEPAAEEPAEAKAPKQSEAAAKKGLFPRPRKARSAPRRRRRRRALLENVWEMSSMDFFSYAAAIVCVIAALVFFPSWASLLFLLAGAVVLPLRPIRRFFRRYQLDGWRLLAIGAALFVLASVVKPHNPGTGRQRTVSEGPPSFIILTWNETGEYGTAWTAANDEGVEEQYVAFHLPSGIYRVLNNNAASAKVTVCDDVPEEKAETDIMDLKMEESTRTVTVLASKSKEITLDEGQHLRLSDGAENVIFQYLSEIPEVVVDEKKEEEDTSANAITAWVNGSQVRMRKSASVSAFIMATFDTGKEVKVTGVTGDWTAVTVDNQKGYIYSRYITYEKPAGVE